MRSIATAFALVLCLGGTTAVASTVRYVTDAELIARSDRVVHGRVIAQRTIRGGPQGRSISTVTTIAVIEDLTGVEADTVEVTELGGTMGRESMRVSGSVRFELGNEVVVCLKSGPRGLHVVGMGLSKFDLQPAPDGVPRLVRQLRDTLVVGAPAADADRSLPAFRRLAMQVTGRTPRPGRRPDAEVTRPALPREAFTFFGGGSAAFSLDGARWAWADSGLPVHYYVNSNAPSPLAPANPASQIQTAMAAWTNSSITSLKLEYDGLTTQPTEGPWDATIPAASVVISFEDPLDEIDDPVLAITFQDVTMGGGGTLHGTAFDAISRAAIEFQNAADLPAEFRQSLNFTRVLEHEIGHTIGLGHTQDDGAVVNPRANIMYASCCYTETPTPPALGPDDTDGLRFLYPVDSACHYTVSPNSAAYAPAAGSGNFTLTTYAQCAWTAASNAAFVTVTSASSGVGPAILFYGVAANPGGQRSAAITVGGQAVAITQSANMPVMTLDKSSLSFTAVTSASAFVAQTQSQSVLLAQTGGSAVPWTAASTQPWLQVTPSSGAGSATLSISVVRAGGLPASGTLTGSVVVSYTGASTSSGVIAVTLRLMPDGSSVGPFGVVDTPLDNSVGVTGAVPFTGWALDDVGIAAVSVCRGAMPGEGVPADGRCGPAELYVADVVFIEGARPDVVAAYPTYPRSRQAGWGVMLLTNMLPNQGNGTFWFFVRARDAEGHTTLLGTRTMTCDNAHATLPFGTIDTPAQGETVSGTAYVNFGWALTENPKAIPTDGSTLTTYVDGVPVGHPSYDNYRVDIATLFPGLANSNGAVGFQVLNTTTLANGLHTIVWTATDSANFTEGLGSRYFTVSNGATAPPAGPPRREVSSVAAAGATDPDPAAQPAPGPEVLNAVAPAATAVAVRRGWDPDASWEWAAPTAAGRVVLRGEEINRFEVRLGETSTEKYTGYLRTATELAPLPIGSRFDAAAGVFIWSPGVGFVGTYDFVFVRWAGGRPASRREVRIVLRPKGRGRVGPQVLIDTPTAQQRVDQPFLVAGWATDLDAEEGTGIETLHAWAYPLTGGAPIFLGAATMGGERPDVAAVYGDQFRDAGYGLVVGGLTPGEYGVAIFAWSRARGDFLPATVVHVTVR